MEHLHIIVMCESKVKLKLKVRQVRRMFTVTSLERQAIVATENWKFTAEGVPEC